MRGNLDGKANDLDAGVHPRTTYHDSSSSRLKDVLLRLHHSPLLRISAEILTDRRLADLMGLLEMALEILDLEMGTTLDCYEMDWAHIVSKDRRKCWNQCAARQRLRHEQNGSVPQPWVRLLEAEIQLPLLLTFRDLRLPCLDYHLGQLVLSFCWPSREDGHRFPNLARCQQTKHVFRRRADCSKLSQGKSEAFELPPG